MVLVIRLHPCGSKDVKTMFSQANLSAEIERVIPTLQQPLHTPECEKSIYRQVDVLSHYVADKACANELVR